MGLGSGGVLGFDEFGANRVRVRGFRVCLALRCQGFGVYGVYGLSMSGHEGLMGQGRVQGANKRLCLKGVVSRKTVPCRMNGVTSS